MFASAPAVQALAAALAAALKHPLPNNSPNKYISFYAEDFFTATDNHSFAVLAGDTPPTIVGGYGKWQTIDRPLRRGLTVFQGYDPMSMQVAVRFIKFNPIDGSWQKDAGVGATIETEIAILEWMGGESITTGPSPLVYLATHNGQGQAVPLIPFEYQPTLPNQPAAFGYGNAQPWIVTGLEWGEAIRGEHGYRIRQDATVTVQYYQAPGGTQKTSQQSRSRPKAVTVVSAPGADTCLKIARLQPTRNAPELARTIKNAPQNKDLHLRSVTQVIKHGKKVVVPAGS